MQIFLTYDYELFFGEPCGSVQKCILEPSALLLKIAERTGAKFTFFIDVGYLKQLEKYSHQYELVRSEHDLLKAQVQELVSQGHDCQLHIHPHWEDCSHDGSKWIMVTDRYKLDDFSDAEIDRIIVEYHEILSSWTGKPVHSYRAGGWCLQPFDRVQKAFSKIGITHDSTVFPGGKCTSGNYYYDFTSVPDKSKWKFSSDLCVEDSEGSFSEYPIGSHTYSALFFWRLFILGRLKPKMHKPIGDGYPMSSPGLRKKMLSTGMRLSASSDGYFVTKLQNLLKRNQNNAFEELVILGHPKACTHFALEKLENFIQKNKEEHQFITFSDLAKNETS